MQLDGKTIVHKTFGQGIITDVSNNVVTIHFSQGEKRFLYPDAFIHFLILKDKDAQKQIDDMLSRKEQEKEAKRRAAQEAQERAQRMRDLRITPDSQAVFGFVYNDRKDVFSSWSVSTGRYLSGYSKGQPRLPVRLKPNSSCLLTQCQKGAPEKERRIIGAFMVKEDFFGDLCRDGVVRSHERHRLELRAGETLPLWDYFAERDRLPRWGNTEFRYFANHTMQRILFDLKRSIGGSEDREAAEEFYQYFCKMNRLPDYKTEPQAQA